jgi:hypothetical protein
LRRSRRAGLSGWFDIYPKSVMKRTGEQCIARVSFA